MTVNGIYVHRGMDPLLRFLLQTEVVDSGCWLWRGATCGAPKRTYGHIQVNKKLIKAHRFSYEVFVGIIPEDREIDHLCQIKTCVNPAHLEAVSRAENMRRYWKSPLTRTHCNKGLHEYTDKNTINNKNGSRQCRECKYAWFRAWLKRRKSSALFDSEQRK